MTALALRWQPRAVPLTPAGVVGSGPATAALAAASHHRADHLTAAGRENWLLIMGNPADLPWADGCQYVGWEAGLLLPTTLVCLPPPALLRDALPPAALRVLLPDAVLLTDRPSRPVDPAQLERLGQQSAGLLDSGSV